ncbi:MAG TPA: bacillithiol biosynthesis deacetylase BshB1 [Alphaproteobacteria bacterium]
MTRAKAPVTLDALVINAHPDDAEVAMGGTILKMAAQGYKLGMLDLSCGELGTRGTDETRKAEAAEAATRMNLLSRDCLDLRDGFFRADEESILKLIKYIRRYRPQVLFGNPPCDRHPDHDRAHHLIKEALFLSGLVKVHTVDDDGVPQSPWRPRRFYCYLQSYSPTPDFIVDITPFWEMKKHVMMAYHSQFHFSNKDNPAALTTPISTEEFWNYIEARARALGYNQGASFSEGFLTVDMQPLKVDTPMSLL